MKNSRWLAHWFSKCRMDLKRDHPLTCIDVKKNKNKFVPPNVQEVQQLQPYVLKYTIHLIFLWRHDNIRPNKPISFITYSSARSNNGDNVISASHRRLVSFFINTLISFPLSSSVIVSSNCYVFTTHDPVDSITKVWMSTYT